MKHSLNELRPHGIHISLDDFGTGYSSLSFLLSLPVDEIKVDRSFVSDMHLNPERRELVRTVVQLGRSLRKRVVAEGVETAEEMAELAALGCDCAQGWLVGKPMLIAELEANIPPLFEDRRTASRSSIKAAVMLLPSPQREFPWPGDIALPEGAMASSSVIQ